MGENGLRINLRKTKNLVFCINMGLPNKSGKDLCSVLQTGEGSNAILCGGCLCSCTRVTVKLRTRCALTFSSGAPDAWGRMAKEPGMKVAFKHLHVILEFFYLRTCFLLEVAAS